MSKPAAISKGGKELHVKLADVDNSHDAKVKKVLTTRYNMEQLKKITVFDSWVDEEMEKLTGGRTNVEVDFEEWDICEPAKRQALLESKLAALPDTPARKKFIEEYSKRAAVVQSMLHDATLK